MTRTLFSHCDSASTPSLLRLASTRYCSLYTGTRIDKLSLEFMPLPPANLSSFVSPLRGQPLEQTSHAFLDIPTWRSSEQPEDHLCLRDYGSSPKTENEYCAPT